MALMSDIGLPADHVREQVASAVDVVVHLARLQDGRRVVAEIAAIEGVRCGDPVVVPLFAFSRERGSFTATGRIPTAMDNVLAAVRAVDDELFHAHEMAGSNDAAEFTLEEGGI